jgi:hypothetical protein
MGSVFYNSIEQLNQARLKICSRFELAMMAWHGMASGPICEGAGHFSDAHDFN